MENQNYCNALPLKTLPSDALYYSEADPNHYSTSNESCNFLMNLPQWIYSQQTPQNYFQFLAVNEGTSGVQNPTSQFNLNPSLSSGFRPLSMDMPTDRVLCVRSSHEVATLSNFTGSQNLIASQVMLTNENPNEDHDNAAMNFTAKVSPLSRSYDSDRRRRLKIAGGLEALQQLLPHSKRGGKAAVLDDVINYVKHLQFQVKELSQSRLGGESSGTSVLLEGCGHYLLEDQMSNEPMEELMGKLLEVNPFAATQLLESRGLLMMPMALAEGLHADV